MRSATSAPVVGGGTVGFTDFQCANRAIRAARLQQAARYTTGEIQSTLVLVPSLAGLFGLDGGRSLNPISTAAFLPNCTSAPRATTVE